MHNPAQSAHTEILASWVRATGAGLALAGVATMAAARTIDLLCQAGVAAGATAATQTNDQWMRVAWLPMLGVVGAFSPTREALAAKVEAMLPAPQTVQPSYRTADGHACASLSPAG